MFFSKRKISTPQKISSEFDLNVHWYNRKHILALTLRLFLLFVFQSEVPKI